MMQYDFDEIIDRHSTYSSKWDGSAEMRAFLQVEHPFDKNTIPLFTADMDFACPPAVVAALHRAVDHRIFGYTGLEGVPAYYEAVARWFRVHYNWEIPREQITYVNGTVNALHVAVRAFTKPGDGVLITRPVYGPFTGAIEQNGRKVVNSQLVEYNGRFTMNFDDIAAKARDPRTKLFLLCSPHNPLGRVWTQEELTHLAKICAENNVLLISDEVHCDLRRRGVTHHPLPTVADASNTIVLTAVNKTFNLAGLQCTNAVIPNPALRETFRRALGHCSPTPFAIAALIAAYTECDDWCQQVNTYLDGTFNWVFSFLDEHMPTVKYIRPEGTYVLWMDFRGYGLSTQEVHDRIYRKANVILEGGALFDPCCGEGFERICLPSPRSVIQTAFRRIAHEFE